MPKEEKQPEPVMTTVGGRPTRVLNIFEDTNALVPCRLSNGEDVYVPLRTIFALLERDFVSKMQMGGQSNVSNR